MMLQKTGERQIGTTLDDIRVDHRARYEWAAGLVRGGDCVLDVGCGVGYGATILAGNARRVHGIDLDEETVAFAEQHWSRDRVTFEAADACSLSLKNSEKFDLVVIFEVIEHLVMPELYLRALHGAMSDSARLVLSVPNEAVVRHTIELNPFHIRHYTPDELRTLIASSGYIIEELFSQNQDGVFQDETGWTLIAKCRRDPSFDDFIIDADGWNAAFQQVSREVIGRGNVIRKLQKEGRQAAERINAQDEEICRARIREDASQSVIQRTSVDLHHARSEVSKAQSTIIHLREVQMETERALSEAAAVLRMQNLELQGQKAQLATAALTIEKLELQCQKAQLAAAALKKVQLKATKDGEKKLKAQLKFFNPKRPTIGSLGRLCLRYRFFVPIVVMAPLNSFYAVYKKLKTRFSQSER